MTASDKLDHTVTLSVLRLCQIPWNIEVFKLTKAMKLFMFGTAKRYKLMISLLVMSVAIFNFSLNRNSDISSRFLSYLKMNASLINEIKYILNMASRFRFRDISCARIFDGDENYTEEALALAPTFNTSLDDQNYLDLTEDCDVFRHTRGYVMSSLTEEEKNFPIAFSLVVYTDTEMVERLLRAIYRPQNYYCIHVDLKASESYFGAIKAISECFSNVFLSAKRVDVQWGTFTVLEPELICMKELWRYRKWKYFINLTGQEFPLKTNFELVKILKSYDGANNIDGTIKNANTERWKDPPPDGLRPVKGSVHITASRLFVDYILHNDTAKNLLNWTRYIDVPDEAYFATLNFNPQLGLRGTFKDDPDLIGSSILTRYKIWYGDPKTCAGRTVRSICILNTGDLYRLGQARELVANKFFITEDRVVISCLEEKLFNDTRDELLGVKQFDEFYYRNQTFVKDQII